MAKGAEGEKLAIEPEAHFSGRGLSRRLLLKAALATPLVPMALSACSLGGQGESYTDKYLFLTPGSAVEIADLTVLITQARRRSSPEVIPPYEWYQWEHWTKENIAYILAPNQVEVVHRPFHAKIDDTHWLLYFPPNDRTQVACVAVTSDVDKKMRNTNDAQPGLLRYLEGSEATIRSVEVSVVATETIGNLKRRALYMSESGQNLRLAQSTIIEFSP